MIAIQQNTKHLVQAPINYIQRECPKPTYDVVGRSNNNTSSTAGKICMTTLTDAQAGDFWQWLIRWRYFDDTIRLTWPNKLNYCIMHRYQLFDESKKSLDNSRPPAWSKITATKRLLTEENCDWVFWLDADTVIMNSTKKIEDFLPTKESSIDLVLTHQKGTSWNAGAFLLRKSDWSLKFLDTWWSKTEFVLVKGQADAGDNTALKHILKNMDPIEYAEKVATPPRCQFNSVAKFFTQQEVQRMTPDAITNNKRLFMHEENYHRGDFIAHVAGLYFVFVLVGHFA
jgi:mannan polymerase II complex MNN10 subunit